MNSYNELVLDPDNGELVEVNCAKEECLIKEEPVDEIPLPTEK